MSIRRRWIIVWLIVSGLWIAAVWTVGREIVSAELGHRYQYIYSVRPDAAPWEAGRKLPLYEVFRSPSGEKLPALFTWLGYQGVDDWNLNMDDRRWVSSDFPDGTMLYLDPDLTDADKTYLKNAFWSQRGIRQSEWDQRMRPWIAGAVVPPLLILMLIGLARMLRKVFR